MYGTIVTDTQAFQKALRDADARLEQTAKNVTTTEKKTQELGVTTASAARQYEKLNEKLNAAKSRLDVTAQAFGKGEASAKEMASALTAVDKAAASVASRLKDASAQAADFGKIDVSGLSGALGGLPGSSIISGFIGGGVAGGTAAVVGEAINQVKNLASTLVEAGKDALTAGAEFERTSKGLAVFTGGAGSAKAELKALDAQISNMPGLKLQDAEEGYLRLRALGFEAKTSTDLLKGLAVQTQLVGATSQDVNRVVTNLIQLSAGSARASQDIKETIHSIPSLRGVFESAFGTSEGAALGKIFQNNPSEAIEKFADALGKVQAAQPGLSAALTGLENSFTTLKREFADPVLPVAADSVRLFTQAVDAATPAVRETGAVLADFVYTLNLITKAQAAITPNGMQFYFDAVRIAARDATGGVSEYLILLDQLIRRVREASNFTVEGSAGFGKIEKTLIQGKEAVEQGEYFRKRNQFINETNFSVNNQSLTGGVFRDKQQELAAINQAGIARQKYYDSQIKEAEEYYKRLIETDNLSEEELVKARRDKEMELLTISRNARTEALKSRQDAARKAYEIEQDETKAREKEEDKRKKEQERITKELERELEKRQRLIKSFNDFRYQSDINTTDNPFQKLEAERRKAIFDANERFGELGPGYTREATERINREFAKKTADGAKQMLESVRSIVASASSNPWVKFYADATEQIEKATEATKYLSRETQRAAMAATQNNIRTNAENMRVNSALRVADLRVKADEILYNRELNPTQRIWSQYNAIQNVNASQDAKNRALAGVAERANIADIPNQLRGIFYDALVKEAAKESDFEKDALDEIRKITATLKNGRMQVEMNSALVEVKDKRVTVTQSPTMADTAQAMDEGGFLSYNGESSRNAQVTSSPFNFNDLR